MTRVVLLPLVFALSGAPVAAVVCDLLLCVDPVAADAASCHEHAAAQEGVELTAAPGDCNHLLIADASLGPGSRPVVLAMATTFAAAALVRPPIASGPLSSGPSGHGAPRSAPLVSSPLRI